MSDKPNTPVDLLSNKVKGLRKKSDRNKKRNSLAHSIARKTDFSRRFYGTAQRVAKFKVEKQEYLKRKKTIKEKSIIKPEGEQKSSIKLNTEEGRNSRVFAKMTKPELLVYECLRELGFEVIREYKLSAKYFDFFLKGHINKEISDKVKSARIVIEEDGIFWHSKDSSNITLRQMQQRIEDSFKNAICIARGYSLIRIWEDEIAKDTLKDKINDKLLKKHPDGSVLV